METSARASRAAVNRNGPEVRVKLFPRVSRDQQVVIVGKPTDLENFGVRGGRQPVDLLRGDDL